MGTTNRAAARADFEQLAETRGEIKELTEVWKRRLRADSPPVSPASTGD